VRRAALAIAVTLAVAIAHLAADDTASARAGAADPELARLLRVMAFTKAAMAAAAVWLVDRLLRRPLGSVLAACLAATAALMAAAPVLMWHVAHVGTGALLFHAAARPAARAGLVPYRGLAVGAKPRAVTLTMADAGARRGPQFGTAGRDRRPKRATPCGPGTASLRRHAP